jgi:hypothetical protein
MRIECAGTVTDIAGVYGNAGGGEVHVRGRIAGERAQHDGIAKRQQVPPGGVGAAQHATGGGPAFTT